MKRLLFVGVCLLFLSSCSKKLDDHSAIEVKLNEWLLQNCQFSVAESSTGTIVFDAAEIKLDGKTISNAGIYFFQNSSAPHQFPTIKQVSSNGYMRDIELGNSIPWCDNYRSQTSTVQLKIVAGDKMFISQKCPISLQEHETLPVGINWIVASPKIIEIRLSNKK